MFCRHERLLSDSARLRRHNSNTRVVSYIKLKGSISSFCTSFQIVDYWSRTELLGVETARHGQVCNENVRQFLSQISLKRSRDNNRLCSIPCTTLYWNPLYNGNPALHLTILFCNITSLKGVSYSLFCLSSILRNCDVYT